MLFICTIGAIRGSCVDLIAANSSEFGGVLSQEALTRIGLFG
jgi:hypothetical protein